MTTTSREYAEALFELAVQGNVTEETSEGLETVISALMQTPEYRRNTRRCWPAPLSAKKSG